MRILHTLVATMVTILTSTEFSLQMDNNRFNPFPSDHPYLHDNSDPNIPDLIPYLHYQQNSHDHQDPHLSHFPDPNYHTLSTSGGHIPSGEHSSHSGYSDQREYPTGFGSHRDNNPDINPYNLIHTPELYVNNPFRNPATLSPPGQQSTTGVQPVFVVHPTFVADPNAAEPPSTHESPPAAVVEHVPVRPHDNIHFHVGPYHQVVLAYKARSTKIMLRYIDITFTFIYYKKSNNGRKFEEVPTNRPVRVMLSLHDNYVLGIYDNNYRYRGLYALYNGKYHRVTMPPGNVGAELMIKAEEDYFYDFRQFEPNPNIKH